VKNKRMPDHPSLLLYGANACGREIASWVERSTVGEQSARVLGFIDDMSPEQVVNGHPVWRLEDAARQHRGALVIASVGSPVLREELVAQAEAAGLTMAPPLIHRSVAWDPDHVTIGDGSVIGPGTSLTTNIEIGRHVQINLHCTIAHDTKLGDFVTLSPGCHVSGRVWLEKGAYMGTGAVTVQGKPGRPLVIGESAVLGAGAVVLKNVPPNATVFGVPARAVMPHPQSGLL
jgi:sugar O-acyltransferase (sialic acid O-acetyltransferase NeuD family)